jgi:hypothetical protein
VREEREGPGLVESSEFEPGGLHDCKSAGNDAMTTQMRAPVISSQGVLLIPAPENPSQCAF